ncbi:14288_t:CDS:2 [Cetraspora pellucida]|uniref:14288_t:CDS:1 n=1 Tax=Cetraspora pellucida TaxID=1433469 RepID=A0A9N8VFH2_9GLOM|nr:14288_t:CDS:2 [Cetraspora pellucida]
MLHHHLKLQLFDECYDPLAYLLLFLNDEQEWAPRQIPYRDIPLTNELIDIDEGPNNNRNDDELESDNTIKHRKFVTAMQYYAYRLQIHYNSSNMLLQIEYSSNNIELYKGLQDAVLHDDSDPRQVRQRIVLPFTFIRDH